MRFTAAAMALSTLGALLGAAWGCTGLSKDCELNLTCPATGAASATGTGTSTGTGTGGGDGGTSCIDVFTAGDCNTCLEASCCQPIIDCKEDAHCLYCLNSIITNDPLCTSEIRASTHDWLRRSSMRASSRRLLRSMIASIRT